MNIQVKKENTNLDKFIKFKMTLYDKYKWEYPAECYIGNSPQDSTNFVSYCLFIPPLYDTFLYYKKNSLDIIEGRDNITINNDFYVIAQKCYYYQNPNLNIRLSFRQLYEFIFWEAKTEITFKIFLLATESIKKGKEISIFLNLMLEDGSIESDLSKALCTLDETVDPKNGKVQADFSCKIPELKKKKYKSFILNNSTDIVGIPRNETLLDPVKTAEAIQKKYIIDFSLPDNKNKFPPSFTPESINGTTCSNEGQFKILGSLNTEIEKKIEFMLPVTYPQNYLSKCTIDKTPAGKGEIKCRIGSEFKGENLKFEQQIIREGLNELLVFESVESKEELNCAKGNVSIIDIIGDKPEIAEIAEMTEMTEMTEIPEKSDKIENSTEEVEKQAEERTKLIISFRQINQFVYNSGEISFMLFALLTEKLLAEKQITIFVNLIRDSGEREEEPTKVTCTLIKDVSPVKGKSVQGDFKCSKKDLKERYHSLRLNSSEAITSIPKDEILLDPVLTQQAIKNKKIIEITY